MNKEIHDLKKHETWTYVLRKDVPSSHRVTKSRWVYKIKLKKDGSIERFKSRFVVCGYSQTKGIDYTHAFAATMRATSFRTLLALAAGKKLKLEHFDVTNAFTQAEIDSEIYVEPPKGYETYDEHGNPYVLRLNKALYGTKQAARMWQLQLKAHLTKMGFKQSVIDPCLFTKRGKSGNPLIVGVYVDDIVFAHDGTELEWFTREFTGPNGFNSQYLGPLSWFLGVSVNQSSDYHVTIHQEQYIKKMMERFVPMQSASAIKHAMPCDPLTFQKLGTAADEHERAKAKRLPCLQLIGSLIYLSTMTRPDIAYYMSVLCSFMHDPSPDCYYAAIDLLLYVVNTKHKHIHFTGSVKTPAGMDPSMSANICANSGLIAYSDASWRRPDKLGFSMFGFVIYLFGAPVCYAAKKLKIVALSSAEAEYAAATGTCKEIIFIRNLLSDLNLDLHGETILAVDNKACIQISENHGVTGRTQHFSEALHFIRHCVDHKVVKPVFVRTAFQHADGFTKALGKGPFRDWSNRLLRE